MNDEIKITKKDGEEHQQYVSEALLCIEQLKDYVGEKKVYLDFKPESLKFTDEFIKDLKKEITWYNEPEKFSDLKMFGGVKNEVKNNPGILRKK